MQMNHMTLVSGGGGKQPSNCARGDATIGEIMKQLVQAISTPFDTKSAG